MFGIKVLVEKLDALIASGSLSDLDLARAMGAIESIEKNGVNSVATLGDLPAASNNKGRFFFVTSENQYVLSNGTTWSIDNVIRDPDPIGPTYSWGFNGNGRLGDGTTTAKSSPVSVVGGFTDWIEISGAGGSPGGHTLGLRENGAAWSWGSNNFGQLGDNSVVSKNSPVAVVGGFTDFIQLSAGGTHSIGLRQNGTIWAWGSNGSGQLGDGTIGRRSSPVSVVGGFTDWTQVSAGAIQNLGLRQNGTAWAWGAGGSGRLGDGTTVSKSSPVSVVGGFTDWTQVSAGNGHGLGVRSNGTAWAWGFNGNGQLGNNSAVNTSSPVLVAGGFTDWVQVSAGNHSLGVRTNGTAWGWGFNNLQGQVGDGTSVNRSSPVSVVGGFTNWIQVSAGYRHSLGIRSNGTAWAWGNGTEGRLGDNSTVNRSSPVSVVGGFTGWVQVNGGYRHSLGIIAGGKWSE
jgi:alpha-tubulin suppressor-like RCC1 family protein